MSKCHLCHNIF